MDMVLLLIKQNIVMFVYLLIGYLLFKKKLLTKSGSGEIGRLLLYVIMPMAILKSYIREFSGEMLAGFLVSFAAAAGALLLAILISTLYKSVISFRKIWTNPIVISFIVGILLFFMPVQLPEIVSGIVGTLASMNGPLAMIVLGAYLAQVPFQELFTDRQAYLCALARLIVIPFCTILALMLVPRQYEAIRTALLLVAAAPVGSNVAIFAQLYGKEYTDAVKDVCLSTIFSIITLPVITATANAVWQLL